VLRAGAAYGARTSPKATSIAASRNRSVSAMLSAPATIPASNDIAFARPRSRRRCSPHR
jgi:hypothetical protein